MTGIAESGFRTDSLALSTSLWVCPIELTVGAWSKSLGGSAVSFGFRVSCLRLSLTAELLSFSIRTRLGSLTNNCRILPSVRDVYAIAWKEIAQFLSCMSLFVIYNLLGLDLLLCLTEFSELCSLRY